MNRVAISFLLLLSICSAAFAVTAPCNPEEAAKCTQPALAYFLQRYVERKTENITDAKWEADMTKQCELDQSGRHCAIDFSSRCFPANQSNSNATAKDFKPVPCQEKVKSLTSGCSANSSIWHRACEQPLMEQLHTFLTGRFAVKSEVDFKRLHSRMCCEIGHYVDCVNDRTKTECNASAKTTFQDMFQDLRNSYRCDPADSFKGQQC
ncbi:hypothetical protein BV898_10302 [Hypsibius exemplaris]|uniref:Uncharacterized protein n=1 Tax=Hypsibius exemplaris TaxID=2072580 RepID=A0A1W0WK86_HYPEX|nr:hypothetical protein BV898_10302 [Hypsibius exemplaris]